MHSNEIFLNRKSVRLVRDKTVGKGKKVLECFVKQNKFCCQKEQLNMRKLFELPISLRKFMKAQQKL